eukprot:5059460-Pyramimonas_sp.AAC.1
MSVARLRQGAPTSSAVGGRSRGVARSVVACPRSALSESFSFWVAWSRVGRRLLVEGCPVTIRSV